MGLTDSEDKKKEKAAREASLAEIRKGMKVLEQRKEEGDLPEAKADLYGRLIAASGSFPDCRSTG